MMSGPAITWLGRLTAEARSRPSAVRMTQEKSWPLFSTPERAVRNSVFAILRAMLSSRLARIAMPTPAGSVREDGLISGLLVRGRRDDDEAAARRAPRHGAGIDDDGRERRLDEGGAL